LPKRLQQLILAVDPRRHGMMSVGMTGPDAGMPTMPAVVCGPCFAAWVVERDCMQSGAEQSFGTALMA
jgi:hypothetical protein